MRRSVCWPLLFLLFCSVSASAEPDKPLFVDGVRYEAWELSSLMEQVRYTVVEKDAIYGFTTVEGVQEHGRSRAEAREVAGSPGERKPAMGTRVGSGCSAFNKNVGCGGVDWLILCPLSQYAYLPDSWNDVISCVETGSDVGYYTVLYKCYYFSPYPLNNCYHQIKWVAPGVTITDLTAPIDNMNNVTSSIRFCSNIDPYSCTQ